MRRSLLSILSLVLVLSGFGETSPGPVPRPHPRLFLSPEAAQELRGKVLTSEHHRQAFALLRQRVAGGLESYEAFDGRNGYRASALAREAALAYRITGDKAFAELAYETLLRSRARDQEQPDSGFGLSRAMLCLGYSIAYDWCWEAWTAEQRASLLAVLTQAAEAWPGFFHWNVEAGRKGSNWVGVTRSAEFLLHLAARGDGEYGERRERLELCVRDLLQHLKTAYGPSGWTQEGLGYLQYTFAFLGPAALASRDTEFVQLYESVRQPAWHRLAWFGLSFRAGQAMLQSGVGSERVSNEGFASLVFAFTPRERLAEYRTFYDRHMGVLALPREDLARDTRFDGQRAGSLWALLLYPDAVQAQAIADKPLFDEVKGAYYFRNRWQDRDDLLLSLMMRNDHHSHSWSRPETFGLSLMAFDATFAAGPGKEKDPALRSQLWVAGPTPPKTPPGARLLASESDGQGGGSLLVEGGANLGLSRAERRLVVAFSGQTDVAACIEIEDTLEGDGAFTACFQLAPGKDLVLSCGGEGVHPWFLFQKGEAWLKAWSLGSEPVTVAAQGTGSFTTNSAIRHRLQLLLAVGKGPVPEAPPPSRFSVSSGSSLK